MMARPTARCTGPGAGTQALGLTLQALTPELARRSNLPPGARGVVITAVDPASDAAEKGLRPGYPDHVGQPGRR